MKRRAALISLLVAGLVASACGSGTAQTRVGTAPTPPGRGVRCPIGTTPVDRFCLGRDVKAAQAAALVRSAYVDQSLGAVIAGVWKDGRPVTVGALGDSLTGVPATIDMHHRAGNISAAMLTTVLLQQVDARRLSLTDKLSKWYPNLPAADQITLEMLARSMSGYQHYPSLESFQAAFYADPFHQWNTDDVIAYGLPGSPLYPPGTSWNFSDTNLLILSQVLERATGTPVNRLIQRGVLDRLGLKDTTPPITAALPEPVLHSYTNERGVWEEATYWNPSWTSYAGGMGSNQDDLRRVIEAVGTGQLVSKTSHTAQLAPVTVGFGGNTPQFYYAMGLGVANGWLFTNPNLQGYSGALAYLPKARISIVVYSTRTRTTDPDVPQATHLLEQLSALFVPTQPITH